MNNSELHIKSLKYKSKDEKINIKFISKMNDNNNAILLEKICD